MPSGPLSGVLKSLIRRSQRAARFFHLRAASSPPRSPVARPQSPSDNVALKDLLVGGDVFCFCIPTRFGVMLQSILTLVVASLIAAFFWFEVDTERDLSVPPLGRKVLILIGTWWTCLITASLSGLAGSIIRKQVFVFIYAVYSYFHLIVSFVVVVALMAVVSYASEQQVIIACQGVIRDHPASQQCARMFNKGQTKIIILGSLVLLLEFYGACIVLKYARQLRSDTRRSADGSDPSELEPIVGRRSASLEDSEKDSLLSTGGYQDTVFKLDDDADDKKLLRPYSSSPRGEGSSRDSSADRGAERPRPLSAAGSSSSETAVDEDDYLAA